MVAEQKPGATLEVIETPRITRALRCEIIKPLDQSWSEAGPFLRAQRSVMHRLMNAAVLACLDAHRKLRSEAPQTAAYRAAKDELESLRGWASKHKDERVQQMASIELAGGTLAGISSIAYEAYQKWKRGKGNERIPSFGKGQPIPVRQQESRVVRDAKGFVLECKLAAGSTPWHRFALALSSGRHHETLRNLVDGRDGYRALSVKIDWDERRVKWYALISYSYPRPPAPKECDPDKTMVLHRGVHNFLVAMSSEGHWTLVARGGKLLAQKRKLGARRRSMKAISRAERGPGAQGHGTARRYETYEALLDKEGRVIKTFCQQTAARVRQLAKQWGCGRIVIGDYGGIEPDEERALRRFVPRFPLYQLKAALGNALEPLSLELIEVSEAYVSRTCPAPGCDSIDARQHNKRTGIFHCNICVFERPCDWVSAFHMLCRSEPKRNVHAERLKMQYDLAKKLRASQPQKKSEAEESGDSTPRTRGQVHSRTEEASAESDLTGSNPGESHDPPSRITSAASEPERERSSGLGCDVTETPRKGGGPRSRKRTARKPKGK